MNPDGNILILTSNDFQDKVITHLDKYIIMDDVKLEKTEHEYLHLVLRGNGLSELSERLFKTKALKNKVYTIEGKSYLFSDEYRLNTLNIIFLKEEADHIKEILFENKIEEMSCAEYEYMRIKAGIPEGENEFNDQINPMECGLDDFISFNKGCYIGQEVIARLDSQGKRPKQIIKIESGGEVAKNDKIFTDDSKETGFVSSCISYNGNFVALGFIRSVNLDFQKDYYIEHNGVRSKIDILKIN